jgi:large subunit ribosomal protein L32e
MVNKKNKPNFNDSNWGLRKRVRNRDSWRRPRADSNKKKMKYKFAGASPRVGYKNPAAIRGLHPGGLPEILVHNLEELEGAKDVVVRIARATGARKAVEIEKAAKAAGLRVLNPRKVKKKSKAQEPSKEVEKKEKPKGDKK